MTSLPGLEVGDSRDEKVTAMEEAKDLLRNGNGEELGVGGLEEETRQYEIQPKKGSAYSDTSRRRSLHSVHHFEVKNPATYPETMINFIKANIGVATFAMGEAFKNCGLFLGPILTGLVAGMCVYAQHQLITSSELVAKRFGKSYHPNYAETVELSFSVGPPILRRISTPARKMSYVFLLVTQIGFCCVYFVFISSNVKELLDEVLPPISVHTYMAILLPPVLFTAWIRSLKFLAPLSLIANILMFVAVLSTIYLCIEGGLPPLSNRPMVASWRTLPLFLGTAVWCFEGISMTMPIRNNMKNPKKFSEALGVLNVGTTFVAILNICIGVFSYWRFGEEVQEIITLNLDNSKWLAKVVKGSICISILFTYAMQAYIPSELIWSWVQKTLKPQRHKLLLEYIIRTALVLLTFALAETIPRLSLFTSLIGAVSSTALAYIFPVLMDWAVHWDANPSLRRHITNAAILSFAMCVTIWGTYASMKEIIQAFINGKWNVYDGNK